MQLVLSFRAALYLGNIVSVTRIGEFSPSDVWRCDCTFTLAHSALQYRLLEQVLRLEEGCHDPWLWLSWSSKQLMRGRISGAPMELWRLAYVHVPPCCSKARSQIHYGLRIIYKCRRRYDRQKENILSLWSHRN